MTVVMLLMGVVVFERNAAVHTSELLWSGCLQTQADTPSFNTYFQCLTHTLESYTLAAALE